MANDSGQSDKSSSELSESDRKRIRLEMRLGLPHGENTKNQSIPRKNLKRSQVSARDTEVDQAVGPRRDGLRRPRSFEMPRTVRRTKQMLS